MTDARLQGGPAATTGRPAPRGDVGTTVATGDRPPGSVRRLVAGGALVIAGLIGAGRLAGAVRPLEVATLDARLGPVLRSLASPGLDETMRRVSTLGEMSTLIAVATAVLVALVARRRPAADTTFLVAAVTGGVLLNAAMKLIVERPRPPLAWSAVLPDYSFPSGHAMGATVVFGAIAALIWLALGRRPGRLAAVAGALVVAAIGVSRVYLGYHYPSDVIAGIAAGAAWLAISWAVVAPAARAPIRRVTAPPQ